MAKNATPTKRRTASVRDRARQRPDGALHARERGRPRRAGLVDPAIPAPDNGRPTPNRRRIVEGALWAGEAA
jgi:hypothetical protein